MYQIVYISEASAPFSKKDLTRLLTRAREKNSRLDITGMLICKDDRFAQVLEGDEIVVSTLYDIIEADPRHKNITILAQGEKPHRDFGDWSMGFRDLSHSDILGLYGHTRPLGKSFNIDSFKSHPEECLQLLKFIRDLHLTQT